jgi:hypothetical protein
MDIVVDSLRYNWPATYNTEERCIETTGIRVMGRRGLWCLIVALAIIPALEGFDIASKSVAEFLCLISGTKIDWCASTVFWNRRRFV